LGHRSVSHLQGSECCHLTISNDIRLSLSLSIGIPMPLRSFLCFPMVVK
jgi:hypothetical protein